MPPGDPVTALAPDVAALLATLNGAFPDLGGTVTDARDARARFDALRRPPEVPTPVGDVRDDTVPGPAGPIPVRRYAPPAAPPPGTPPVVFVHGGGWVLGGLDSHDELVRKLVARSGLAAVAVDYRRAPEHPFPAPLDDAVAAIAHVAGEHGGPVVAAGDSAGANLVAAAALRGAPIAAQVLLYPVADAGCDTPSFAANATGYYLTAAHLRWFWAQYAPDPAVAAGPLASPLRAPSLAGLPPAHVVTAELDPLRDEGEAYAERLAAAGVPVRAQRYAGAFHGFLAFDAQLDVARRGQADVAEALRTLAASAAR
jgi:acetyl esterase